MNFKNNLNEFFNRFDSFLLLARYVTVERTNPRWIDGFHSLLSEPCHLINLLDNEFFLFSAGPFTCTTNSVSGFFAFCRFEHLQAVYTNFRSFSHCYFTVKCSALILMSSDSCPTLNTSWPVLNFTLVGCYTRQYICSRLCHVPIKLDLQKNFAVE